MEEIQASTVPDDPALAAEIEGHTTILADGRRIVNLGGILANQIAAIAEDEDPIAEALSDLRRERAAPFEAEQEENCPTSMPG